MKVCCLFLTCFPLPNAAVLGIYSNVARMCHEQDIDVYLYVNTEQTDYYTFGNTCYFSYRYLKAKYKYDAVYSDSRPYYGLMNLPLLDLYKSHPEYDNYIFYEDDLLYQGTENLFSMFDYSKDITFQSDRHLGYGWHWYNNCNNYSPADKKTYLPYHGLLNIFVVSSRFMKGYSEFLENTGLRAFFEYSINSYAYYMHSLGKLSTGVLSSESLQANISWKNDITDTGDFCNLVHPVKDLHTLRRFSQYDNHRQKEQCS